MSAISTSLTGIQAGMERLSVSAANVAGAAAADLEVKRVQAVAALDEGGVHTHVRRESGDGVDLSEEAVELMQAEHQVRVNAEVLQRLALMEQDLLEVLGAE